MGDMLSRSNHLVPGLAGGLCSDTGCNPRSIPRRIPRQSRGLRVAFVVLLVCGLALFGCASGSVGESTRLTVEDFEVMAGEMAQSLMASDALAGRGPGSEKWVVSIDKVLNLSDDAMTQNEQWSIMAQLRGAEPLRVLWDQKAVRFVIPPERELPYPTICGPDPSDFPFFSGVERRVTHTMTATFRSVTRAQAKRRSDLYYCEFDLLDLSTGERVWSGRFEFKRQARGHVWD
jgi:hypothetical protein